MSTAAQWLRELADQIEAGHLTEGTRLVAVVAREIKPGDVVTECVGERLTVSDVTDTGKAKGDGTPLLKLQGVLTTQTSPGGYESGYSVWADQWVVVER